MWPRVALAPVMATVREKLRSSTSVVLSVCVCIKLFLSCVWVLTRKGMAGLLNKHARQLCLLSTLKLGMTMQMKHTMEHSQQCPCMAVDM